MMLGKKEYTVSVVIPCHNCSLTIVRAIESILNQSVPVDEIICVNDASTDRTLEILTVIKNKCSILKIINNNSNLGAAKSRNLGIMEAS